MFEISPVLAGKFDAPNYVPAAANFNTGANAVQGAASAASDNGVAATTGTAKTDDSQYVDPRRYTQWDRTASHVADDPNFSFGDFLDAINPLQHIPVVSSVYRAITGDKINPVSRVAGDILYGGALGVLSAVAGGVSAVGDAVAESSGGKDMTGMVVAGLFGDDKKEATTQLASLQSNPNLPALAAAGTVPVQQQPLLASATTATTAMTAAQPAGMRLQANQGFPLNQKKMPYGGVMDVGNKFQAQDMAIALSEGSHAMRMGNMIYTNKLMNGAHPLPVASPTPNATPVTIPNAGVNVATGVATGVAPAAPTATASAATVLPAATRAAAATIPAPTTAATGNDMANMGPRRNPIPQNLVDDMVMMKALGQYKGVAAGPPSLGANLDMSN